MPAARPTLGVVKVNRLDYKVFLVHTKFSNGSVLQEAVWCDGKQPKFWLHSEGEEEES